MWLLMPSCAAKVFRKSALTLQAAALGALTFDGPGVGCFWAVSGWPPQPEIAEHFRKYCSSEIALQLPQMPAQIRGHSTARSDKEAGKDKAAVNVMLLQNQQAEEQLVLRENLKEGSEGAKHSPASVPHPSPPPPLVPHSPPAPGPAAQPLFDTPKLGNVGIISSTKPQPQGLSLDGDNSPAHDKQGPLKAAKPLRIHQTPHRFSELVGEGEAER